MSRFLFIRLSVSIHEDKINGVLNPLEEAGTSVDALIFCPRYRSAQSKPSYGGEKIPKRLFMRGAVTPIRNDGIKCGFPCRREPHANLVTPSKAIFVPDRTPVIY